MRPDLPVLLSLLSLLVLNPAAPSDDWIRPEPTSFNSRGYGYVAEVFPPKSRQNAGSKPLCYFYLVAYPGLEWNVSATRVWRADLVNGKMPYQALVSMNGVLVTLNEHGKVGFENAVVIYDTKGRLVRRYHLGQLLTPSEISQFDETTSSRWWTKGAKYYMTASPAQLYTVLKTGTVLQFSLTTGDFRKGRVKDFADLTLLTRTAFPNEETEVWPISLRFSSITDVIQRAKS